MELEDEADIPVAESRQFISIIRRESSLPLKRQVSGQPFSPTNVTTIRLLTSSEWKPIRTIL